MTRAALRRLKRWQADASVRPGRVRLWLLHFLLPVLFNLVLVAMGIALMASGLFKFSLLFMGDLVVIILICSVLATAGLVLRTRWMVRILKTS